MFVIKIWEHNVEKREIVLPKNISWNQFFRNFFNKIVELTNILFKIMREKNCNLHSAQCGKTRNSLPYATQNLEWTSLVKS